MIAGVHGCEYSSIEAARAFAGTLDSDRLAGRVVVLPVVNVPAFWGRTPFVVPIDGKNLNRCFPGDPAGSFADALAHEVFERYVRGSDALLDLHGGDMVEALEPFTLYDPSPVEDRSRAMAEAFGLRYVIRMDQPDDFAGMTCTAAAARGASPPSSPKPATAAWSTPRAVAALVAGARNVASWLGMLPDELAVRAVADGARRPVDAATARHRRVVGGCGTVRQRGGAGAAARARCATCSAPRSRRSPRRPTVSSSW